MHYEVRRSEMIRAGVVFFLLLRSLAAAGTEFSGAEEMYERAQYQAVVEVLKTQPAQADVLRLTGKSFFMLGDFRKAVHYFQKLVRMNPMNSLDFQWLGKAWARWADSSSALSAPGHSAQARKSLERAVELDPRSVSALNELLDLYLESRGLDKAQAIADRMGSLNAAEGLRAREGYSFGEGS